MKQFFKKHRHLCLSVAVIFVVTLLLGLNILFPYIMEKNGSYIDATPENLYTLTDKMKDTCGKLKGEVTITFCDEQDRLLSYYDTRYVYAMAKQLAYLYDNIHVETVNLAQNPTAVNRYKATSATVIEPQDVIVSCGARYRILDARSFWTIGENASDASEYYSFNGEYKLATALLSVTSIEEPIVCFAYGHGEHIYVPENDTENEHLLALSDADRSAFYHLVQTAGLKVQYINLDTEEIPDDCVLLVMDGPTTDYAITDPSSISEVNALKKIHNFLAREETGSWMLFKDPSAILPNIEDLAADWGVRFDNDAVIRGTREDTLADAEGTLQKLIISLNADEEATPYAIYQDLLNLGVPPRMIVENSGSVRQSWISQNAASSGFVNINGYYFDFMYSSEKSYPVDGDGNSGVIKSYPLAGLGLRMRHDTHADTEVFSYFFGAGSTSLTQNEYLEDPSFSNYDVMFATVRFISRVDEHASIELGGLSLNSPIPGGKPLVSVVIPELGYEKYDSTTTTTEYYPVLTQNTAVVWMVVLILIPTLIAGTVGVVILVKRRNR